MTVVCKVSYQMLLRRGVQMEGDMGHMGGLITPRPRRGQYRASFSNTGGSPKPRKWAPCQNKPGNQPFLFPISELSVFVRFQTLDAINASNPIETG